MLRYPYAWPPNPRQYDSGLDSVPLAREMLTPSQLRAQLGSATPSDIAKSLRTFSAQQISQAVDQYLLQGILPDMFGGYPVGADVRGDLIYVLGFLAAAGEEVAGASPTDKLLPSLLAGVDGTQTHSFYSYRVAETLLRFGKADDNPLLLRLAPEQRQEVLTACDSTALIERLGKDLPVNYRAVLARCELARRKLGLAVDASQLEELITLTRAMLSARDGGYLDDSNSQCGRFDIYTGDVYLFTEPLREQLAQVWEQGFVNACGLVQSSVADDGCAIPWGRSTGALGIALTIEVAALRMRDCSHDPDFSGLVEDEFSNWAAALVNAFTHLQPWFNDGLITAHQHRSTFAYRGPFRRWQMTFDVLGKLLQAAQWLDSIDDRFGTANTSIQSRSAEDEWLAFETDGLSGVWNFRNKNLRFSLPVVGGGGSDYVATPRSPGMFEVPVDSDLYCGTPMLVHGAQRFAASGRPAAVEKGPRSLTLRYEYFAPVTRNLEQVDAASEQLPVRRTVTFTAEDHALCIHEIIEHAKEPISVTVQWAQSEHQPLLVEFHDLEEDPQENPQVVSTEAAQQNVVSGLMRVPVQGMKPFRSFWGEFDELLQFQVQGHARIEFTYRIAPKLRIGSNASRHHYHRSLYDPINTQVDETWLRLRDAEDLEYAERFLPKLDAFHLHWPEHCLGGRLSLNERFLARLAAHQVPIIWTQHNLVPHREIKHAHALYECWAAAADLVIHHSQWGKAQILDRYAFSSTAQHVVIGHGHFGNLLGEAAVVGQDSRVAAAPISQAQRQLARRQLESELGLEPCAIRLGILGAPRREKNVQHVLERFARVRRDDMQLVVFSGDAEHVPEDERIVWRPYQMVPRAQYNTRLLGMDALLFPIEPGKLLTTGVIGDALGAGLPAIVSDWPFLHEVLGEAAISYGDDLQACLQKLDQAMLERAAQALVPVAQRYQWQTIAAQHLRALRGLSEVAG